MDVEATPDPMQAFYRARALEASLDGPRHLWPFVGKEFLWVRLPIVWTAILASLTIIAIDWTGSMLPLLLAWILVPGATSWVAALVPRTPWIGALGLLLLIPPLLNEVGLILTVGSAFLQGPLLLYLIFVRSRVGSRVIGVAVLLLLAVELFGYHSYSVAMSRVEDPDGLGFMVGIVAITFLHYVMGLGAIGFDRVLLRRQSVT